MASTKIKSEVQLETKIILEISLREAEALHALTGYGAQSLLDLFYTHLGEHYLKPYHKEALTLLEEFRTGLPVKIKELEDIIETVEKLRK